MPEGDPRVGLGTGPHPQRERRRINEIRPYTGLGAANDPAASGTQLVLGVSMQIGPLKPGSRLDLVPEIAMGLGGRGSFLANAGIPYEGPVITIRRVQVRPTVGLAPTLLKADRLPARLTTRLGAGVHS